MGARQVCAVGARNHFFERGGADRRGAPLPHPLPQSRGHRVTQAIHRRNIKISHRRAGKMYTIWDTIGILLITSFYKLVIKPDSRVPKDTEDDSIKT